MSPVPYPYADGDLLLHRNTYFYSAYGGRAFVRGWIEQRDGVLAELPTPVPDAPASLGPAGVPGPEGVETARLLEYLYCTLRAPRDPVPESAAPWLDRLIQRFEVTKRVHDAYDPTFRARDRAAYRSLALYLRFAEVVEAAYCSVGGLPCLNVLLKCLDTLCALRADLDAAQGARLARLIVAERRHVTGLAQRVGVEL